MASVFRRTRWVTTDGRRVSEQEAARLTALGHEIARRASGAWYFRYVDETGRRVDRRSNAKTKTEARRRAEELEQRAERVRLGLEVGLPPDGGGTLKELLTTWLASRVGTASYATEKGTLTKHLLESDLAPLALTQVTPARIETLLRRLDQVLAAQTVNHVRGYVARAFTDAQKLGRWPGANPALAVPRRRIPRRVPDYLRAHEVPAMMAALDPRWQPLFATAIFTGLRKGELLGLRKTDIDLAAGLITVARSYDHETTKGGHADVIPIAAELTPYLKVAIEASPSGLVFPAPDGRMMSKEVGVEHVLRRALARAGIVQGYRHVCRARVGPKGKRDPQAPRCAHVEATPDRAPRRCPIHKDLLWPCAVVRPLRFHDLRHTTASLLMQSGANPAAVQRILRHSDPRITTEVYGHLAPGYLRAEVDRLRFGLTVESTSHQAKLSDGTHAVVCDGVLDSVLDRTEKQEKGGREPLRKASGSPGLESGAGNRIRTGDPQLGNGLHGESWRPRRFARRGNCCRTSGGVRPDLPALGRVSPRICCALAAGR